MDDYRLRRLQGKGVTVHREGVRVIQPKVDMGPIAEALRGNYTALAEIIEKANEPRKMVLRNAQKRIKSIQFRVTSRDVNGDLLTFEAVPEYEDG